MKLVLVELTSFFAVSTKFRTLGVKVIGRIRTWNVESEEESEVEWEVEWEWSSEEYLF